MDSCGDVRDKPRSKGVNRSKRRVYDSNFGIGKAEGVCEIAIDESRHEDKIRKVDICVGRKWKRGQVAETTSTAWLLLPDATTCCSSERPCIKQDFDITHQCSSAGICTVPITQDKAETTRKRISNASRVRMLLTHLNTSNARAPATLRTPRAPSASTNRMADVPDRASIK